jgi:branched-chain amino acid transport system substrate-binding protein
MSVDGSWWKPALAVIGILVLLVVASGCGGSGDSTDEAPSNGLPDEIVIGAAIAKTGVIAPYDANIAAIEQLVDETNTDGGINGHKIRIVEADNRSDPQQAGIATQKVIEDGADIVLTSCEGVIAAASAVVAEENGKLNVTLCASEPNYGPPWTGRLAFSANRSLISEGSTRAQFAYEKGFKHPFLLSDNEYMLGPVDMFGFQKTWERLGGGELAGIAEFKNSDESIASQINEIKSSDADMINISSFPPGGASAIKQIRAAGIDLPMTAGSSFDGTFWMKAVPDTSNLFITLNGSSYDPASTETAKLFKTLERNDVDTDLSGNLLASYAAGELIIEAISETDTVDGQVLADYLEAGPHRTIMGKLSFSPDNHLPEGGWFIYAYDSREPKLLKKVAPHFFPKYEG